MSKPKDMEHRSARLRHTLRIAEIVGFEYDHKKQGFAYGGFFSLEQLEKIIQKFDQMEEALKIMGVIDGKPKRK